MRRLDRIANFSRLRNLGFLLLLANLCSCVSITYQQTSTLSKLPVSAYRGACFVNAPGAVDSVIDRGLQAAGMRRVSILEVQTGSDELKAQTLKGEWVVLGRTQRKPIGFSQIVKVSLSDPFGRGIVYEGIGEHMGDFDNDDLRGATKAALADLANLPKFDEAIAKSNLPKKKKKNVWNEIPKQAPPSAPKVVVVPYPIEVPSRGPSISSPKSFLGGGDNDIYEIEAAAKDEVFVINGEVFKAKTWCNFWEQGDSVLFIKGKPNGMCMDAELFNLRRKERCEVWCE